MLNEKMLLLILIINCVSFFCYKCGADLLYQKLNLKYDFTSHTYNWAKYYPIKINVDYNIMEDQNINSNIINKYKPIFAEVVEYISKIIKVQHEDIDFQMIKEAINLIRNQINITKNNNIFNFNYDKNIDLYVYPFIDVEETILSENVIAGANPITSDTLTRPIFGVIVLNKNIIDKKDLTNYIKNIIFHEFFHILGFHPHFISYYSFEEYRYNIYLKSPLLLEKAKIHFGCENIGGIKMEDGEEGTFGSHWDARYMQGELMIGNNYSEVVLSDMTLAFLEDLRFYKVNYFTGGLFRFGKNQGCAFLEKNCIHNKGKSTLFPNEFCTNSQEAFCTGSHTAKGNCFLVRNNNNVNERNLNYYGPFYNYCPISYPAKTDNDYYYPTNCIYGKKEYDDEIIGNNSMCFESSLNLNSKKSICYKMECDRNNKQIKVYIGDKIIICNGDKNEMLNPQGLSGTLYCPDYNMICTSEIWCNNIFDCIDKQSITDENTFDYNSNRDELRRRDNKDLYVNYILYNNKGNFLINKYFFLELIMAFLFFFNIY